jgi:PPOX class probable F420-dependent enzyme
MIELTDDVRTLFDGPNFAHIATLLPDGAPHNAPMWTAIEDGRIVIMTSPESRKARNLDRDPRVAISIVDQSNPFVSASVRGRRTEVVTGDAAWTIIDRLANKYLGMDYPVRADRVVMLIEPDHATYFTAG